MLHLDQDDWFTAFSVDQAVFNFGTALRAELNKAEKNCKNDRQRDAAQQKVFRRWLPGVQADTARWRDVAKENPDGVRR